MQRWHARCRGKSAIRAWLRPARLAWAGESRYRAVNLFVPPSPESTAGPVPTAPARRAPMTASPLPPAPAKAAPKISFVSLGCPKALVDSERILTHLRAEGYELARRH